MYLNDETIQANSRFFDGDISKVPKSSLTVGVVSFPSNCCHVLRNTDAHIHREQ
jgi:hypothetical protein